jgi:hypothetical protein
MSSAATMKLVCFVNINGVDTLKTITTVAGIPQNAAFVKSKPGVGQPFLMFNSLPGVVVGAEFNTAPIVNDDTSINEASINTMLADPATYLALLTFA